MLKLNTDVATLLVAGSMAAIIGYGVSSTSFSATGPHYQGSQAFAQTNPAAPKPQWATSATGRVEPIDGEVRISSQVGGKIDEIFVATNDKVKAGDLLVKLDDDEIYVKLLAAKAEVGVRERERNEEDVVTGLALERRNADDLVAKSQRALFAARETFDTAYRATKNGGNGKEDAVEKARKDLVEAKAKLDADNAALLTVEAKDGMPFHSRLESSLALARAEFAAAEIALERTRIRAPADGTVLNVFAKVGETAAPSPENTLVYFGDLSALAVRAEVEERDAPKVRVGQKVVVKADAYPDREFTGTVTTVSQSLASPRIATRGPRRPNDVEVVEVKAKLDGQPPLFTGMRVDVFFKLDETANVTPEAKTN